MRGANPKHEVLDDLVGLGLIAIVYGLCVGVKTWAFLGVFFAGGALRHTELILAGVPRGKAGILASDISKSVTAKVDPQHQAPPTVSAETLVFKEHLERPSEPMPVLLLGEMIFLGEWSFRAVGLAAFVFFMARPLSVFIGLAGTKTSMNLRAIIGWFGVRGIGSVYYLMYAIQHELPENLAWESASLTLTACVQPWHQHQATPGTLVEEIRGASSDASVDLQPMPAHTMHFSLWLHGKPRSPMPSIKLAHFLKMRHKSLIVVR